MASDSMGRPLTSMASALKATCTSSVVEGIPGLTVLVPAMVPSSGIMPLPNWPFSLEPTVQTVPSTRSTAVAPTLPAISSAPVSCRPLKPVIAVGI